MRLMHGVAWLLLVGSASGALVAQEPAGPAVADSTAVNPNCICPPRKPALAAVEVIMDNVAVNLFDRAFHAEKEQFHVSFESVWNNIKHSFEWDDNNFGTNQFAHPYHGSTYYNAARSNGLGYWESAPYAALGSLMWEFAGETNPAALNDFMATTVGGIALGEIFHRTATLIRDNEARGGERVWRELAALPLDPMGAFNRFIRGDYKRVGDNPPERHPDLLRLRFSAGYLNFTGDIPLGNKRDGAFFEMFLDYGDAFRSGEMQPFDVMRLRVETSTRDSAFPSRLSGEGVLLPLYRAGENHRVLLDQRFDFISNSAYLFGGQSVETRLVSRFSFSEKWRATTGLGFGAILLGAVNSEFVGLPKRNYDFGPGLGLSLNGTLQAGKRASLGLNYLGMVLYTLAGDDGHHRLHAGNIDLRVPLYRGVSLGGRAAFFRRDSTYPDDLHTSQQSPEFRVYASWSAG
jgi:hypothetical protein